MSLDVYLQDDDGGDGHVEKATPIDTNPFIDQPSNTVVTIKRGRGKGLGTDADQAKRQAEELAKDPSQKGPWPFPGPDAGGPLTPEQAFAGTSL